MKKSVLAVLAAMSMTLCGASLDKTDIPYATRNGHSLFLDLHIPDGPGPFPAAILVHGGGFDEGSKSTNVKPLFAPLSEAGFAWFSIDYRLAPDVQFPQVNEDLNDAIAWVRTNASTYHVDVKKIALIGESAGGFLVNYAGTHKPAAEEVAAVVDFYGPSDYGKLAQLRQAHPEQFNMATIKRHASRGGGILFFGVKELDAKGLAQLRAVAPIAAVHKGMPPFLCIHGTKDDQVAFEQSTSFCDAIRRTGTNCELITVKDGAHGMSRWRDADMQHWKPEMISWLKKTMHVQ
jgi:acetyl esterase